MDLFRFFYFRIITLVRGRGGVSRGHGALHLVFDCDQSLLMGPLRKITFHRR